MYPGFVGTVLSHFLSLISTLWTVFTLKECDFLPMEYYYVNVGLFFVASNSSLAIIRYGNVDGYKLRRLHIILLHISVIVNFTIIETVFLNMIKASWLSYSLPISNLLPLLSNTLAKDYRTKNKRTDVFLAINSIFLFILSFIHQNYYGMAYSMSYFFGYFIIGESGYFLDTEVPSIDAFQYLTCFLNHFSVKTLCY